VTESSDAARRTALDDFLAERVANGFVVESRTATQAILAPRGLLNGLQSRLRGSRREVVSVDQHGNVTSSPAQPRRW
jgi:hypothetical protein